jgi:hypothetical protein
MQAFLLFFVIFFCRQAIVLKNICDIRAYIVKHFTHKTINKNKQWHKKLKTSIDCGVSRWSSHFSVPLRAFIILKMWLALEHCPVAFWYFMICNALRGTLKCELQQELPSLLGNDNLIIQ